MGDENHPSSGADAIQPPCCAGGCGATGPARPEGTARRPIVCAEGAPGAEPPAVSMLDRYRHNSRSDGESWDSLSLQEKLMKKKKGRLFHCLKSGMLWHSDHEQYFLTLTSSPDSPKIPESFNHIRTNMRSVTPEYLVKKGYMTQEKASRWYSKDRWRSPLMFEYLNQRTLEGHGVLHIVFAGDHWPISFLRSQWSRIHKARQIRILHIKKEDLEGKEKMVRYQMQQYLHEQPGFIRFSHSKGWLFPGYRKVWLNMVKTLGYSDAIIKWNDMLRLKRMPGQTNFNGDVVQTVTEKKRARKVRLEWNRRKNARRKGGRL